MKPWKGFSTLRFSIRSAAKFPCPLWAALHNELATHINLTLMLLWQEYKEVTPEGIQYSHFCDLYRKWREQQDISICQLYIAGEKLFVDYCGQTLPPGGRRAPSQQHGIGWVIHQIVSTRSKVGSIPPFFSSRTIKKGMVFHVLYYQNPQRPSHHSTPASMGACCSPASTAPCAVVPPRAG